ncbi:MAG: hypothetical protein HY536_01680 [Candidatus Colwellbacteria bacterium]|nr:hypothetical protein [Candidatus Colwellbacteria bacterium]
MKFEIALGKYNLGTLMRRCGYAPDRFNGDRDDNVFVCPLARNGYPRFHIYARVIEDGAVAHLNIHLDQKKPSYEQSGAHAHSGEYDGPLIEAEARRIQEVVSGEIGTRIEPS